MHEFNIIIHSFREVREFVSLAMVQPFEVLVGNDRQKINGKNYIGMSSLDYRKPLQVSVKCSEEEFLRFRKDAARFVIS